MGKRITRSLHLIALAAITCAGLSSSPQSAAATTPTGNEATSAAPAASVSARPLAATTWVSSGAVVTQTFALHGGWNTMYLEVEPINPSPLVDPDGDGPLLPAPAQSSLEAIFTQLDGCACLESVWAWNVPTTQVDYIIDPAEGLWDEPGWKHYIPAGKSRTPFSPTW